MKLNKQVYYDKVKACWIGKNIGGTMGAPFEGTTEILDIKGFTSKPGEPLPNDDLDLQLVWLHAMETTGPWSLDCKRLGEYWLSLVSPFWNEYGIGKANMRHGLLPPLSGDYKNTWKDSNGAWIRTEVWACMAPGCPEIAAKYAIEDAVVDHGAGEGTVAAAFVATMQSAAFVNSDLRAVIDLALSKIPVESRVATTVRKVIECYEKGIAPMDCRNIVQQMNADIGTGWFEAPSNVGYTVLGLLYGEGDFKKSMITAINCGDDTDCTAATVGATLGILGGLAAVPTDWQEYIGDRIITMSLAEGLVYTYPKTCTELTERIVRMAPTVLLANRAALALVDGASELDAEPTPDLGEQSSVLQRLQNLKPYQFRVDCGLMTACVTWDRAPNIKSLEEIGLTLTLYNNVNHANKYDSRFGNAPYGVNLRWILPEGFAVEGERTVFVPHKTRHSQDAKVEIHITLRAGEHVESINRIALELLPDGRCVPAYVPLTLLG